MSYLGLKRDIKDGEYEVFDLFDQSYIAKKDQGKLTIAENKCQHRGYKVRTCAGSGPIKCQYHGQRFTFANHIRHHEFGEFIFAPHYLGSSKIITEISSLIGEEFGSYRQFLAAPFHLWIQNTADPNHLFTAHSDSFAKLFDKSQPENVYLSEFESSYTMRIKDEVVDRYKKHYPMASDAFTHIIGFPNLSITSFLDIFFSVESANPVQGGCDVYTRFFMRDGIKPSFLSRLALESNKRILMEDKDLVEEWAVGYKYNPDTNWLPGEARIKRYADEIRSRGLE